MAALKTAAEILELKDPVAKKPPKPKLVAKRPDKPNRKVRDITKPATTYIVVVQDQMEVSKGGIILPDISKSRGATGVVYGVGPDCKFIQKGQRILFGQYDGMEVRLDALVDEPILVMKEDCIRAIIES